MAGPGGGARERIQRNFEVLKQTTERLAGRGDGDLKEPEFRISNL